jgi:hypothetical protein
MMELTHRLISGDVRNFKPTTLTELGLREVDLEGVIEANPALLQPHESGVFAEGSSLKVVRQAQYQSTEGRRLVPDILICTSNAEVVAVEVKRFGNPELAGRAVLAQLVEYATALSTLSEISLASLFVPGAQSWSDAVRTMFPQVSNPVQLASALLRKMREGEISLIVACDVAPSGLAKYVRAAAAQQSLAFRLRVVEITPLTTGVPEHGILFASRTVTETETIARTVVTVRIPEGTDRVLVDVSLDRADEIESATQSRQPPNGARQFRALVDLDQALGLPAGTSALEMVEFSKRLLTEDWGASMDKLCASHEKRRPQLCSKGEQPAWGRFGVGLGSPSWLPGVFAGWLLDGTDHRLDLLEPERGPDLAIILDIQRRPVPNARMLGDEIAATDEYGKLCSRLQQFAGGFRFEDHLSQSTVPNRWHPLNLRVPLASIWQQASGKDERYALLLATLRRGLAALLEGGELTMIRDRIWEIEQSANADA